MALKRATHTSPSALKLEQEGAVAFDWGASQNNRRTRFYRLTREGRKQLQVETQDWEQTAATSQSNDCRGSPLDNQKEKGMLLLEAKG